MEFSYQLFSETYWDVWMQIGGLYKRIETTIPFLYLIFFEMFSISKKSGIFVIQFLIVAGVPFISLPTEKRTLAFILSFIISRHLFQCQEFLL